MPQTVHVLRRISPVVRVLLAAVIAIAFTAGPGAQEPPAGQSDNGQTPVFRGGVDTVSVDVTVTDKNGNPVTDLTAADFEIRESGKPQTVDSFRFIQTDDGQDDPRAAREILSLDEERMETAREANRLFVLFLDDYHVRRGNSMQARTRIAEFFRDLSPHDLVAVATPLSNIASLTFSRNHAATANIVMGFQGRKYDYTPMNIIEQRYQTMPPEQQEQMRNSLVIRALGNVCEYLGTLREGRKTLVYVSEGMSGSLPAGVRTTSGLGPRTSEGVQSRNAEAFTFFENSSLLVDVQSRVFRPAMRNNVSIYTLDPRGLANFEFGVEEPLSPDTDKRILQESIDLLRVIAEQTDGRAIVGRNDPRPALRQMVRDSSAYYLLGYTSTVAPRDGKFHEIEVRVKRRDIDVRARKGYWAYSAEEVARATAPPRPESPAEVVEALDDLASVTSPGKGRAVGVWMGFARGPAEKPLVTLAWEASTGAPVEPSDVVDRVAVVATSLAGVELYRGSIARDPASSRGTGQVSFEAPPGNVRVRLTPENSRGLRLDTDEVSFDVPDLTGTGPQVTTPFLYRGRTARDIQQIRAAESPTPVVAPIFARSERMLIRFGAYGPGGVAPGVTMRLLNQAGAPIAALPAPAPQAAGLFESELSLGSFPPGDYLVEIAVVVNGETAKKLVAVRVTG